MANIAVLGYGTVGSGVVEVIRRNQDIVNKKANDTLNVKWVLDLREFEGDPVQEILTHDYNDILNDDSVDIVCEVMGGIHPAYEFSKEALLKGKSVCTSNKALVAEHGAELIQIAKDNNCNYFFEAAVGGGIPIIRPLLDCITADDVTGITGILNGTTNFILSKMAADGADFDVVLKEAQDRGYAERNPEADVEGYDACRKIAILASVVAGRQVDYQDIFTEGITKISSVDFAYAKELGMAIKTFGKYEKVDGEIYAMVSPMMIDETNPLYHINDVYNGVLVYGNMLEQVMFYGQGAGKLPTASAVVSDVVIAAREKKNVPITWESEKLVLGDIKKASHKFFVRFDEQSVDTSQVKEYFGDVQNVACESVNGEYAMITPVMTEGEFAEKIAKFDGVLSIIRVAIK